jgi:UDP-3-O-acyl-N-acetylglucosamine deacetylase
MLDALGDLALSGLPLLGHYSSFCGGHRLNNQLLIKLFSDQLNYENVMAGNNNPLKFANKNFKPSDQNYSAVI